jgi:hypothetical protein
MLLSALLIWSVAACKKKDDAAKADDTSAKTESAAPGQAAAPAAPAAPAQEPVDICGKIAKADIEAAFGAVEGEPKAEPPQGSLLGSCAWGFEGGAGNVSARPAREYDATVRSMDDGKEVAGIGEKTVIGKYGALVKLAGKPYMLQVMVMTRAGKLDPAKTETLAKLAAEKL